MKRILFAFLFLCSFWNYGIGQINFQGCPAEFGSTTYVLVPIGTTNDGGTVRNTYDTSPIDGAQSCNGLGFGFCEFRIIWDVANDEWLFQLTDGASFFTIYTNTSPSAPNPPDLTLGTWVENTANTGGTCAGPLTTGNSTLTGDVQSTTGGGAPEINLRGNGNSIVDGDVTPSTTDDTNFGNVTLGGNDVHTFTIDNTAGTAALTVSSINISGTNAADFTRGAFPGSIAAGATGTFTLTFTPSAVGVRNATVTINNNDANEGVYNYAVRGTGVGLPEINILGNGNSITDGDVTPSTTDDTNFGNVTLGGNDVHTFTIDNTAGTAALTISSIVVSGTNAADFVRGTFPGSIAAGATGTFTLTFTPSAVGVRNATVTVNNNDANEAVYNYAVRGTGVIPGTALNFDGTGYVSLPTTVSVSQLNEFTVEGWVNWDGTGNGCIYAEGNTGSSFPMFSIIPRSINGGGMELVLRDNSNTGLVQQPTTGVIPTGAWTHVAVVRTSATNVKVYINGILTDDLTFTAPTAWTVNAVNIGVRQRDFFDSPFDGDIDELRIWNKALCQAEITAQKDCELSGTEMGLVAYYDFNQGLAAANNSTETTLLDRQTNTAANNGTLTNMVLTGTSGNWVDGSTNGVTGTCTPALLSEINVQGNGNNIANAQTAISTTDDTDFGNVVECGTISVTKTFTIANTGTGILNISSIMSSNANFAISGVPSTVIASGSATFDVTFDPTSQATINSTITINNNDCDEAIYTFAVEGVGFLSSTDITRGDALNFDGANDNVSTGITSVATSFTAECWVSLATLNPSTPFPKILGKWRSSNLNRDIVLDFSNSTNLFRALISNEATGTVTVVSSTTLPVVDEWYHLAMSYDGITLRLYVNGIEEASQAVANGIDITPSEFYIGSSQNNTNYWNGQIDEVRIWNAVRTANEIRENMHLTLKDCPTGLLAYYQMNDGTGSSVLTDKTGNGNNGTLTNMDPATDWVTSSVNIGNDAGGNSNSQTINIAVGVSTQNFTNANATMRFFAHSGVEDITVTYQEFTPNGIMGANGVNIIQNPMWTVNKSSSTETMLVDYTFMFAGGTFTSTDPAKYSLYYRTMNSEGTWTKIGTASAVTAVSATFGKIDLAGQFMVVQDSENDISDVRGNMYTFDGTDDHISFTNNLAVGTDYTVETWFKTSATGSQTIITLERASSVGSYVHFALQPTGELRYLHRVPAGSSGGVDVFSPLAYNDGEWHHAAIVKANAQMSIYVDGVLVASGTNANHISDNVLPVIGQLTPTAATRYFNGSMDEFRIWNVARTQDELRENMHLTLKGNETGLVSYYQFNNDDPISTVDGVKDAVGGNNGTTRNMATTAYVESEVGVAGGTSDRITIGAAGVYTFPNTDVAIEFGANTPTGEIVVSRLETEKPHGWETIGTDVDNEYFVINNYGTNQTFDPLLDITFDRLSYVSPTDVGLPQASSPLQMYKRADNAFGATWGSSFGGADNATAGSNAMISFNTVNNVNSFSQIVLANNANNSDLPVELMKFEAERLNADKVQLDWATASELNNEGFYIERMLEIENEFETVGYVKGQGNSANIVNYQLIDENSYTGVSYYRLRQVDFDGTTTYSQIRAIAGRDNKINYMDVSIYPNPVQDELKIRFNALPKSVKSAQVSVTTIDGKVLQNFTAGIQSYQLLEVEGVDQLAAGLYLLSLKFDNGERAVQKFIKE